MIAKEMNMDNLIHVRQESGLNNIKEEFVEVEDDSSKISYSFESIKQSRN